MCYLCSENKNSTAMKNKVLYTSLVIAFISFIVMIALLISLILPFDIDTKAVLMLLSVAAGVIFGFSLFIIIMIGFKNSNWGDDLG